MQCHFTDPEGRPTLKDYCPIPGIYACGRLDADSEGLVLLTDDGALIDALAHPRAKAPKVYWAQVEGIPDEKALEKLRRGIEIDGKRTLPCEAKLAPEAEGWPARSVPIRMRKNIPTTWICLILREGRNRQVRRMTAAVGFPTLRLVRIAIGPLRLDGLAVGNWREVSPQELHKLGLAN